MIGLVFHPRSPRSVSLDQGLILAEQARGRAEIVALLVDPDDASMQVLVETIRPDWLQLHGAETPERVRGIRRLTGVQVMKALGVSHAGDLAAAGACSDAADMILLDAKPPADADHPGGHGTPFDWRVLAALDPQIPFVLGGGLRPETVGAAITAARRAGANIVGVDVSSGVEDRPGGKNTGLISNFIASARAATSQDRP